MSKPGLTDFVDTAGKAKDRELKRKRIQEILEKEAVEEKKRVEIRTENRKIGQVSLGETSLSHFMKTPSDKKQGYRKRKW